LSRCFVRCAETRPIKGAVGASGFAFGCCFSVFFLAMALVDWSIVLFVQAGEQGERLAFYGTYRQWKGASPIIAEINMLLFSLVLPGIYMLVKSMLHSLFGWSRAYLIRHVVDIYQGIVAPFVLLPMIFLKVIPQSKAVADACVLGVDGKVGADCQGHVDTMETISLVMLLINISMLTASVVRYNVGVPSEDSKAAAVVDTTEDKKEQ